MAILVALGGAAIGSATGIGGSLGWTIGSMLGQLLFPAKGQTQEGPRLGDLSVSSSAYGSAIPIGWGIVRTSGNIIWSKGIKETKHKQSSGGGKGGSPKQTSVTYTYSCDFAIAFCEGPIDDVLRIWADGKLIFDKRSASKNVKKKGLKFTLYKGTETQLQDPIIVADKGTTLTPAFRGLCYLVFDDLQLADFGNRIPSITAEISFQGQTQRTFVPGDPYTSAEGNTSSSFQTGGICVDLARGFAYVRTTSPYTALRRFNVQTMKEDRLSGNLSLGFGGWGICPDGNLIMSGVGGNYSPLIVIDQNSLTEIHRFGFSASLGYPSAGPSTFETAFQFGFASAYDSSGARKDFAIVGTTFGQVGVLALAGLTFLWGSDSNGIGGILDWGATPVSITQGASYAGSGDCWVLSRSGNTYSFRKINVSSSASFTPAGGGLAMTTSGVNISDVFSFDVSVVIPGANSGNIGIEGNMVYDQVDGGLIFMVQTWDGVHVLKYRDGAIVWKTLTGASSIPSNPEHTNGGFFNYSVLQNGTVGFIDDSYPYLLDTASGELLENGAPQYALPSDQTFMNDHGMYDSASDSFIGLNANTIIGRWYFRRAGGVDANVADIITDICGRVDLDITDLDVSDLDDDTIPGYIIGSRTAARGAIEPLASAFFFDGVESDFLLKFVQRGAAPVRALTQADLMVVDNATGEPLRESRQQEVEMPERLTVLYMDQENDYQQGTQSSKRLRNPIPSMYSHNQISVPFPAVFHADFAKQLSEKMLYTTWVERSSVEVQVTWKHMDLDPTDVVTIALDNGTTYRARLSQVELGAGFLIPMTSINERGVQYVSTVSADKGTGPLTQSIAGAVLTKVLLLDSPLLRDSDEPPGRSTMPFYFFMGGYLTEGWNSGVLSKSSDNLNYTQIGQIAAPMTWGGVFGTLADPPSGGLYGPDTVNTLRVMLTANHETLASCTDLALVNGANACAVLKTNGEIEIVQFRDVAVNVDGSYSLSYLLRGRRGTDTMAYSHTAGETFLFLDAADGDKFSLALSELNATRYYKGTTTGDFLDDAELVTKASTGRSLKPYAPVHVAAAPGTSNSVDISWLRRTRTGGDLQDYTSAIPLNEDTEAYELEIYSGPGGTLKRTVTGLTSPTWNYSSANQTTDGFTPRVASVTVRVYQISAQVGRGFTQEYTVNVQ